MARIRIGRPAPLAVAVALIAVTGLASCERREAARNEPPSPDTPIREAAPAVTPPSDERPVDAETLPYADVNETLVYGYFAFPSDMVEPLPAMLLVHDWWGLDDDIRTAANRLAAAGYIVLAIDLYGGATESEAAAARQRTIRVVEGAADVEENIRQALDFVDVAGAPSVGIVGWGFGGGFALNAAIAFPERIDATVIFYGQVPGSTDRLATLESPVLGLFGAEDRTVSPESVEAFAAATNRLGKPAEIESYAGIGHGFADPKRRQYDAAAAARAWERMLDFLATHLVPAEES